MNAKLATDGAGLAALCQACGLCCDGSLFGRVDLEAHEIDAARKRRLLVLDGAPAFEQPCAALASTDGGAGARRCTVYDERPMACRRFVCRLYVRHEREGGPLAVRLAVVRRVRQLVALLEATGLTPADFEAVPPQREPLVDQRVARATPAFQELARTLEEDFARSNLS